MNGPETARVFVGCDPNDCDLEQMMVLDYSLRKHASISVEITWMRLSHHSADYGYSDQQHKVGWNSSLWATPFSGMRWGIPAFCNFEGRAFYTDADVLFLSDIAEIWNHPITPGKVMLASGEGKNLRLGELLWDCSAARDVLPPMDELRSDPKGHSKLMKLFQSRPDLIEPLDPAYSNLDGDDLAQAQIKVLHYSDMSSQFSHKYSVPRLKAAGQQHWFDGDIHEHHRADLTALFEQYYGEALEAGYKLDDYRPLVPYGAFHKESQSRYRGNAVTRAARGDKPGLMHRIRALFGKS